MGGIGTDMVCHDLFLGTTPWEFRESTMGLSFSVHASPRSPFLYSNRRRGVYFIFREPCAAFIRGRRLFKNHFILSVLNIILHMVTFLLGNSNKSQYINVVHFVYSIVIFTQS